MDEYTELYRIQEAIDAWLDQVWSSLRPIYMRILPWVRRLYRAMQRIQLCMTLVKGGVPVRLAGVISRCCPVWWLPDLDPNKWPVDRKTPPECSRTG